MFGLNKNELKILRSLNTPQKIQDFLNKLPINFEEDRETCFSPRLVLRHRKAHCIEGAIFAAAAFYINGERPLIVDMNATKRDYDHVICVFKREGKWGAIGKTNHAVLRYREPVYKNIRELVMSFFHEYFDNKGRKNLRSYSVPFDLSKLDHLNWIASEEDIWFVHDYLDRAKHFPILTRKQIYKLRKADKIEVEAGKLVEWKKENKKY